MSPEIRVELLKLAKPNVENPSLELWIKRATELERYVTGAGQPSEAPPKATLTLPLEARNNRQSPGPARK